MQSHLKALLLYGGLDLEDPEVRLETPAPSRRRIDIEVGRSVIECKKDLRLGNVRQEGRKQLAGYVVDRTKELGQRYSGILTDGAEWELLSWRQSTDELELVSSFELKPETDPVSLVVWLEGVLSTAERLVPTPVEVSRKLGSGAPGFDLDLTELRDAYALCQDQPEVAMKRELWARLLAAAFGNQFSDDETLFIEHTYLVLTAEIIAHALMGFDLASGEISPEDLVSGAVFRKLEIGGVVEADFFDWPVEIPQGQAFVSGLARRLSRFDWSEVEHDVLKILYESVIDAETRHALGEYYTPDWLAERMVESVIDDPLEQRALDPACGSGTFLFWALRRFFAAAEEAGVETKEAVAEATKHVFGIDLHPVAVTLARVTYLLAIGTERLQERDALSIPVYLGDSIQVGQNTSVLAPDGIEVYTTDGLELFAQVLKFPEEVVAEAGSFDRLVAEMATRAANRKPGTKPPSIKAVLKRHAVSGEKAREELETTFAVLCHLHDHARDHIWGYYVRNLARPLEFTRSERRVDRLIGNPPWLRYNAMPQATQREFKRLSQERQIWAPAQVVTSQDLAGLFVARCAELYLKPDGAFGFVMPVSALTRLQYEGFRTGEFSGTASLISVDFDVPWELSGVRPHPFPVPAAVVFGERAASSGAMPEVAEMWEGKVPDHYRAWEEAEEHLNSKQGELVVASDEYLSPYGGLVRQGANLVPRVLMTVEDQPATALGVPAGKRAVQSDRSAPEREPWSELETVKGTVEEGFVYPMALGESVLPFRVGAIKETVIPFDGQDLMQTHGSKIDAYPGLAEWWRRVAGLYDTHKPESTEHDLLGQIDYQSKLTNQFPLVPHRLIYTGRGAIPTAARVEDPRTVVDHALYWTTLSSAEEGQYLCAVLNSSALVERVQDALAKGAFGNRNIHRAPFRLNIPEFAPEDGLHKALAALGGEAEELAAGVELAGVKSISAQRKRIRRAAEAAGLAAEIDKLAARLLDGGPTAAPDDQAVGVAA